MHFEFDFYANSKHLTPDIMDEIREMSIIQQNLASKLVEDV
jgi:hypothetical protein